MTKTFWNYIIIICCASCQFSKRNPGVTEAVTGNWMMLYPEHQRNDANSTGIYARSQDSIVQLMGLKLFSFTTDGKFQLIDSLYRNTGNWNISTNELQVTGAGKGWNPFNGRLIGFKNDTLQVVEYIPLAGDTVRIVWFLKKINDGDKAASLFEIENNIWRRKPTTRETNAMLAKKLKQLLEYYSLYFEVVAEESMYFVASRAPLPFRYYQHGAQLVPYNDRDAFSCLFYNKEDAAKAYDLLEDLYLADRKKEFPTGNNYVIEYAKFLHRLAGRI